MKSSTYNRVIDVYRYTSILFVVLTCLLLMPLSVDAELQAQNCDAALEKETYSKYLSLVDKARIVRIQRALRQIENSEQQEVMGALAVDGVLGGATRSALYEFCLSLKAVPEGDFVTSLVKKLDQKSALITAIDNTVNDNDGHTATAESAAKPLAVISKEPSDDDSVSTPIEASKLISNVNASAKLKKMAIDNSVALQQKLVSGDVPSVYYQLTKDGLATVIKASKQSPDAEVANGEIVDDNSDNSSEALPAEGALASLDVLVDVPFVTRSQFIQAVSAKSGITEASHTQFMAQLVKAAMNQASRKLEPIVLAADCGCVRDLSDTVYGFYPYWRATKKQKPDDEATEPSANSLELPKINYSVFNRIAYYALTLEESGEITAPQHWNSNGKLGNFINLAHRHKTKVDLTVYSDTWAQWSDSALNTAVMSVYNQLLIETEYKESGVMAYVPFFNTTKASPDGVTLYFDGYFDRPDLRYKITDFVTQLYDRLSELDRTYTINILLDVSKDELANGRRLFGDLKNLLVSMQKDESAYVDFLLVFLDEPTTNTKKILRSKVENEFSGGERMDVLRKIIPVISPYGHENDELGPYDQFKDDLIYFENNFTGVGLWPMPIESESDAAIIAQHLINEFAVSEVDGLLNALSNRYPVLCEFACPNRWVFRLGFDLLLFFIVIYGVLALFSQRLRRFYSRHPISFMLYIGAIVAVFIISLTCDPFWKQRRDIVLLGLLLIAAAVFMIRKYSQAKQGPLP